MLTNDLKTSQIKSKQSKSKQIYKLSFKSNQIRPRFALICFVRNTEHLLRLTQRLSVQQSIRDEKIGADNNIRRICLPSGVEIGVTLGAGDDGNLTRPCTVDVFDQRSEEFDKFMERFIWCDEAAEIDGCKRGVVDGVGGACEDVAVDASVDEGGVL